LTPKRRTPDCRSRLYRVFVLLLPVFVLLGFGSRTQASSWISIHTIQTFTTNSSGTGYTTSYMGSTVTTSGVVIAVLSDGFYIENDNGTLDTYVESWDSDTCTSEGIYVYTGSSGSATLNQHVLVTGLVEASNNSPYGGTQINTTSGSVTSLSTGNTLPSTISSSVITAAITNGGCSAFTANSFGQWLPFEGMLVNVPSSSTLLVTQGTSGTVNTTTPSATSNGQFWGVITTTTRPFRATGISVLDPAYVANESSLSSVTTWDANPQLLLIDSKSLAGTALDASAGTEYTGSSTLVGVVDYHISTQGYTGLLLTSAAVSALSEETTGNTPTAAADRQYTDQITLATLDLNDLVSTEDNRIIKLSNAIVNYLKSPDILAVQNASSASLSTLVSYISSKYSGPSYTLLPGSTNTTGGSINAFLVNPSKFDGTPALDSNYDAVITALAADKYTVSGSSYSLFDEALPMVLKANIARTGLSDYTVYVVNASLKNRSGLSATSTSEATRIQREKQAELLTTQVLEPIEASYPMVVLGGFNSFEFSDGYVDTLGILDGQEASDVTSSTVWLYDSTYNSSILTNSATTANNLSLSETNPATSRYTYVESGSAEQTDHILYTTDMDATFSIDYARIGADFPVSETYDISTVARATTHDGVVGYFGVPYPTMTTITSNLPNPSYYDETVTFTVKVCVYDSSTSDCASSSLTPSGGTVELLEGTTVIGTGTVSNGLATITVSTLTVGTHTITAKYEGYNAATVYYEPSTTSASVSQIVNKDITSLVVAGSPNPSYSTQTVTITATATSSNDAGGSGVTPTGTITFTDTTTGTSLGSGTLSSGVTTISAVLTVVETHVIEASYAGDDTNSTATGTYNQVVLPVYATTSTLACSPNPIEYGNTVTCTDTVTASTGTPTGTVTFYDGTTSLGTATLSSGIATYTTSSLTVGSHPITAVYTLNYPYLASTSNEVDEIVYSTFSLTAKPASATIYTGEAVNSTITVVPGSGFTLDVALTCSGLPDNSTCTFTPSSVTGGSGTSKLVIQTTAPSQATTTTALLKRGGHGWPLLAGLLLFFVPKRFRRRGSIWIGGLLLSAALAASTLTGCGSSGTLTGGTTPGTYTVTVTGLAVDGTLDLIHTATVTVTVKSMF
jgi:uncharacterized protein